MVVEEKEWREKTRAHTDEPGDGVQATKICQSETGRTRNIRKNEAEDFHSERHKKIPPNSRVGSCGAPADTWNQTNVHYLVRSLIFFILGPCCHLRSFSELLDVLGVSSNHLFD